MKTLENYKFETNINPGEYQDEDQTKEWIDSLITQENLPTILTHYDFLNYRYFRQDKDLVGRPFIVTI